MRTADIVIKTFPRDYEWLPYLFRSVAKYATGWRQIIVLIEQHYEPPELPDGARLVRCRQYEGTECPTSIGVPMERLGAWRHSDAEVLVFIDSDCVFCRSTDLQADPTINIERPVVLWREWDENQPSRRWRAPAAVALGFKPPYWTMLRYPFVFPRGVMQGCWEFCGGEERLRTIDLTDWEVICNFALVHRPEAVTKVHISEAGPACVHQFWNKGGATHPLTNEDVEAGQMGGGVMNPGVQREMERLGLC